MNIMPIHTSIKTELLVETVTNILSLWKMVFANVQNAEENNNCTMQKIVVMFETIVLKLDNWYNVRVQRKTVHSVKQTQDFEARERRNRKLWQ